MRYIESPSVNPYFNLALEQYVFDSLDNTQDYCMLWRNDNAIIIGKHQNTIAEVNSKYVGEHGVHVVRRLSGGGAVYHDLGNVNFTFISSVGDMGSFDFSSFCMPVVRALESFGVHAQVSGRNDMTIEGKKFSGNAQYAKRGRIMHHGTLMFDSDLDVMRQALAAPKDRINSIGIRSVESMVTNIKPYMPADITVMEFMHKLRDSLAQEFNLEPYSLTQEDIDAVTKLQTSVYETWQWNYGNSPAFEIQKERRIDGVGKIQVFMDADNGILTDVGFYGDYFGSRDTDDLKQLLTGRMFEESSLRGALANVDISDYFNNLDLDTLISILMQ